MNNIIYILYRSNKIYIILAFIITMKLFIRNNVFYHYEVIESVIVKYREMFDIKSDTPMDIYLSSKKNKEFEKYIADKYPKVKFGEIKDYDYYVNATIYDKDYDKLDKKKSNKRYISHEITERLKQNPNVYFLTPLSKQRYIYSDILPYANQKKTSTVPIYIVQGNLNHGRRYLNLLMKILDQNYKHKFIIKLVGKGVFPKQLEKHKDKIVIRNNLNFNDFHKEFLDAYCILPLITKKTHSQYYTRKLTSTINYARAYKLKCLIDKDLQNIYNLNNVEVFNNIDNIQSAFTKTLESFYKNDKNS